MQRYSKAVLSREDAAIIDRLQGNTAHTYMVADYYDGRDMLWDAGRANDPMPPDRLTRQTLMATRGLPCEVRTAFFQWNAYRVAVAEGQAKLALAEEALA